MLPTIQQLKGQIGRSLGAYKERDPRESMLSGMSLVATFLAKCDGSETITPQVVASLVAEVAKEAGFVIGRLS